MKNKTGLAVVAACMVIISSIPAFGRGPGEPDYPYYNGTQLQRYPGWANSTENSNNGPIAGSVDDRDWDDDEWYYGIGWRYSPDGWWYQFSDGSWITGGWRMIDGRWYLFRPTGHILTGWYEEPDGSKYYLNPVDDGMYGSMRTGWQIIDGKTYYFNSISDGTMGKMLVNTTTPDGYRIGVDGVLIP